jgi:succinate-acetate transporter protein
MSNLSPISSEIEPSVSQLNKSTIVCKNFFFIKNIKLIYFCQIPIKEPIGSVILSNEQFQELLGRVGKSTGTKTGVGNPAALGLGAFALTTFILSVFNAGEYLIDIKKLEGVVLPVALFYGGLAQFLAGMWEFKINNTFGATAFTSYGAFWMSFAGYIHIIVPRIKKDDGKVKTATGLFLLAWFIFTLIMNVAAVRVSKFLFILFNILNITFLLLIIGNLANLRLIISIGGWFGILTAFIAWYGCAAILINTAFKKQILPLGVYA